MGDEQLGMQFGGIELADEPGELALQFLCH
jgi:hypothetical protein